MVLEHAPVTGLTVLFSSISAAVTSEKYTRPPHRVLLRHAAAAAAAAGDGAPYAGTSLFVSLRRMCVESIPLGGLGATVGDIALSLSVVLQMRVLERRWGSASFLAFLVNAAATGVCLLHILTGPPASGTRSPLDMYIPADGSLSGRHSNLFFTPEAVRVLTGAASLVPLTALVVRYMLDVPSSSRGLRIPGTSLALTERVTFILPLLKLILAPNGVLQPPTHKRDVVQVSVGLWTRLLLALAGLAFGFTSAQSPRMQWWLRFFSQRVCAPVLNAIRPFLVTPLFGSSKVTTHTMPPHLQQPQPQHQQEGTGVEFHEGQRGAFPPQRPAQQRPPDPPYGFEDGGGDDEGGDRGRISVGNLTGAVPSQRFRSRNTAVPPTAVAQIMEMGIGQSEEQVAAALRACGGDVSAAVNLLLSGR